MNHLESKSFEAVNGFVHNPDVEFEELQSACLDIATELEKHKEGNMNNRKYYNRQDLQVAYKFQSGNNIVMWNEGFAIWATPDSFKKFWTKSKQDAMNCKIASLQRRIDSIRSIGI